MRLLISLFSPATGTWGGLTRGLAVADVAVARGDTVAFCASGSLERAVRAAGYSVYSMPAATMFGLPSVVSHRIEARSQRGALPVPGGRSFGDIWFVYFVSGYARAKFLRELVTAQRAAAAEFRADAVFTDLDPGAYLAAAIEDLPIATAFQSILRTGTGSFAWRRVDAAVNAVLRDAGHGATPPESLFFGPSVLKLVPSIRALDRGEPERADLRYLGQLVRETATLSAVPFSVDPRKRYVFTYVGTGSVPLGRLERVLPAAFPADGPRRCVVGSPAVGQPYRRAGVEFQPFVPADAVLPLADWTICHGGQNTIIESLRAGVPLIVFPGPIFERRFNAAALRDAGVGLMGELRAFEPAWLEAALDRRDEFKGKAAALGAEIGASGGAVAALDAIAGWTRCRPRTCC